jgi:hypothetical protein
LAWQQQRQLLVELLMLPLQAVLLPVLLLLAQVVLCPCSNQCHARLW